MSVFRSCCIHVRVFFTLVFSDTHVFPIVLSFQIRSSIILSWAFCIVLNLGNRFIYVSINSYICLFIRFIIYFHFFLGLKLRQDSGISKSASPPLFENDLTPSDVTQRAVTCPSCVSRDSNVAQCPKRGRKEMKGGHRKQEESGKGGNKGGRVESGVRKNSCKRKSKRKRRERVKRGSV